MLSTALSVVSIWLIVRIQENVHRRAIEAHVKTINEMEGVDCMRAVGPPQSDYFDSSRRWVAESSAAIWWGPIPVYRIPTFRVYAYWPKYFNDEKLIEIVQVDCIRELKIPQTAVTDAGIKRLNTLSNLVSLDVTNSRVSQSAVDDLRRALPNLTDVIR
jgi:hypothetical protein